MELTENVDEREKIDIKDSIINNISIVTHGIINDLRPNNSYSNWKNTDIGMKFIKNDSKKFYKALNMWIDITQRQIIGTDNNVILEEMKKNYLWINNFLEIKEKSKKL